jgi:succinyl-diaminopimelate desuccinylase
VTASESEDTLAGRLGRLTLGLVDIPSVSRQEGEFADYVESTLTKAAHAPVRRWRNSVWTTVGPRPGVPYVLLVGHLDTVPAQDNLPGHLDGEWVCGLGAADMKGALAVMLDMVSAGVGHCEVHSCAVDYVFYDREEVSVAESGLTPLFETDTHLDMADLAIVMEPTAEAVQFGCVGNLNANVSFRGRSGHSARPWLADNAIHRAIRALHEFAGRAPIEDYVDGFVYREVASITGIDGGIAANVIPDEVVCHVNMRYSPRRDAAEAEALLREWVRGADCVEVLHNAPGAMPCSHNSVVAALISAGNLSSEPKQAWTDVAQFAARGIDAVNFGPGDPVHAHTRDERVSSAALARCRRLLDTVLAGRGVT